MSANRPAGGDSSAVPPSPQQNRSSLELCPTGVDLSLPKTSYGSNAFEINDIQEQETETSRVRPLQCYICYIALKLATVSIRQGQHLKSGLMPWQLAELRNSMTNQHCPEQGAGGRRFAE